MSGLAQIVAARGDRVSGSDPQANAATERLEAAGATIYRDQLATNISSERPDLVVVTAAVKEANPELAAARAAGVPVMSRAEYLGELMEQHSGPRIGITGTHGKTTTTAMTAAVLMDAGLDPTVLVGGEYQAMGGNVRVGRTGAFVTEACEAYDSFLQLHPDVAIITNVEADHLDYYGTEERVFESFEKFVEGSKPDGIVIACGDDWGVQRLMGKVGAARTFVTYGQRASACDFWAEEIQPAGAGSRFVAMRKTAGGAERLGEVTVSVPGSHIVLNALAVIALADRLGIPSTSVQAALTGFTGADRRFQVLGESGGITIIDDYAHHPTEIRATLAAAKSAFPARRVIVAFQPHLYSRTRDFLDEFARELSAADVIIAADIYAAREQPIPGVRSTDLIRRIAQVAPTISALYAGPLDEVVKALLWVARNGDVVISMGAGNIDEAGRDFLAALRDRAANPVQPEPAGVGRG